MGKEFKGIVGSSPIERDWMLSDEWQPKNSKEFMGAIEELSLEQLKGMGFCKWEETTNLYLIPGEWFDKIPEGLPVVSIFGKEELFSKDTHDDDTRFGCLSYGIIIDGNN